MFSYLSMLKIFITAHIVSKILFCEHHLEMQHLELFRVILSLLSKYTSYKLFEVHFCYSIANLALSDVSVETMQNWPI